MWAGRFVLAQQKQHHHSKDHGLAVIHKNPKESEDLNEMLCQKFNDLDLSISEEINATWKNGWFSRCNIRHQDKRAQIILKIIPLWLPNASLSQVRRYFQTSQAMWTYSITAKENMRMDWKKLDMMWHSPTCPPNLPTTKREERDRLSGITHHGAATPEQTSVRNAIN